MGSRGGASTFVGRGAELERLGALVRDGAPVTLVTGPAGVGKSRLVARYAERHEANVTRADLGSARDL